MSTNAATLNRPAVSRQFWKLYAIVWIASMVGFFAGQPAQAFLVPQAYQDARLLAAGYVEQAVINALVVGLGLLTARQIGLGLPFVSAWLSGRPEARRFLKTLPSTLGLSVVAVSLTLALDYLVFRPNLGVALPVSRQAPPLLNLLASPYGGIEEEVQGRLFVLTLVAWACIRLARLAVGHRAAARAAAAEDKLTPAAFWIANGAAALLFGLSHLPATAGAGIPLTTVVVVRALILNGAAGLLFGWLYWKRGLESAMASHFAFDVIYHVLVPLLLS